MRRSRGWMNRRFMKLTYFITVACLITMLSMSSYLTFVYQGYLISFNQIYMYAVFKVRYWLIFYQSYKRKISFLLISLVKPVFNSSSWLVQVSTVLIESLLFPLCSNKTHFRCLFYIQQTSVCFSFFWSGAHLLSHTVSSAVPSAACVLTVVFGMGTGVSHKRIGTRNVYSVIFDN